MNGYWEGHVEKRNGRSSLMSSSQKAPLKIAKPFARSDRGLTIYLMDASPGLFGGDLQTIICRIGCNSSLYLTNQSSCKIHPSHTQELSLQMQTFYIENGALFEYIPEPIVPYEGSRYEGATTLYMQTGGSAIVGEIITPGRIGRGEFFLFRKFQSTFSVYWDEQCMVWDTLVIEPMRISNRLIMGTFTHVGTLYVLSEMMNESHVVAIRKVLDSIAGIDVYAGCSALQKNGMIVRMLGNHAWRLQEVMRECHMHIRKIIFGLEAMDIRK